MDSELTIKDLIDIVPLLGAAFAFLYAWRKDRLLKRKEYADKIRLATANTIAKLERRKELLLSFFDNIQPIITDTDVKLWKERNVIETRDFLWRELTLCYHNTKEKILNEQIEIAYIDLYSYDPKVKGFFDETIFQQTKVDKELVYETLLSTQAVIMAIEDKQLEIIRSAYLGNQLREVIKMIREKYKHRIEEINSKFNSQVEKIIYANDKQIFYKEVVLVD